MDNKFETSDPRVGTCACGQKFQWYRVLSRRVVVVSFQKNLFEFGDRYEYPLSVNAPLQFGCFKCHQTITLPVGDSPVVRKLEKVKTAPVRLADLNLPPEEPH